MMKLFKNKRAGKVYMVLAGERIGQFLCFLDYDKNVGAYPVLVIPDQDPIYVTEDELKTYITDGYVEYQRKLPSKIKKETFSEFEFRKNKSKTINTLKES